MRRLFRHATQRLCGVLRVMVFFSVVSGIGLFVLLKTARAEAEKRAEDLGQKLLAQLGPLVLGEPQTVRINGQDMFIASRITPLGTPEVLERIERYCHDHSGGLAQAIEKLPGHVQGQKIPDEMRDPAAWLTVRSDRQAEDFGQITCFARDDQTTLRGFFERLTRFLQSGDVSELGDMRYAVARRVTDKRTHVLTIWTEGHFNIANMFPGEGDAPGSDAANLPRPPESVRLLSAEVRGQPYAARIYESRRSPSDVLAFYDEQMGGRGFVAEPVWMESEDAGRATATPSYARAFSKEGALWIVSALTEPAFGEGTQVSVVEVGTRGKVTAVAGVAE